MAEEAGRALWERLEAHHKAGYLSLHMPGHKENAALAPYLARLGAELDITELPEFDDLHDPSGVLARGWTGRPSSGGAGRAISRSTAAQAGCWRPSGGHPPGGPGSGGPPLPQGCLPRH